MINLKALITVIALVELWKSRENVLTCMKKSDFYDEAMVITVVIMIIIVLISNDERNC